ncbi:Bicarbonate transport ATP-binding protein CmpD [Aquimixticola soesokkakensis]|uniref:Bicarbonate transport ATP-binding protein CmpD n=1 Tax=Aquimixticola soesokkakensis TaxID=1519096 RepID=A0A1Y5RQF6_9RHOB|nr:ABC transporter ATP-binding protein [Aquimixticola soesokkakensis]SLN20060.1 Bicarbonate transport ATP-binding protein CmpD [Aquimixticola soesokkakensis]
MTLAPPAISFQDVAQVFATKSGPLTALGGVNLEVAQHEFVAVLGPSGCGKSTLLRLTSGLMMPSAGQITVLGLPVTRPREDVGIVFQQPTLLPWASVEENVVFPVKHTKGRVGPAHRDRAREILETVGLGGFGKRLPGELSGGMQQRVGIARALFLNPDLLMMDEPFSALDALTRDEMGYELLRLWQASPKTVMFITHSIPEAVLLADRVLVMSERPGRVIADLKVPLGRPRSEESLRAPEVQEFAAHLRSLLIKPAKPSPKPEAA